jgi:putative phosphoribosyl transferase
MNGNHKKEVDIATDGVFLKGDLYIPLAAHGLVIFAHGSGSGRLSPRNRYVAETLNMSGLATLLADLLTLEEEKVDLITRELRFDMELLRRRVTGLVDWAGSNKATSRLAIGCFGASTGAAGALMAAADRPEAVRAVVSRGGRPDLAGGALHSVKAPILLIVGGNDEQVIELNRQALTAMTASEKKEIRIVPGASHLFEEPGKLDEVSKLAGNWFVRHLGT